MMVLTREEKERLVLDLYNQGRTYREIAKEARISPRDIGSIVRKAEQNNQKQQQEASGKNNGRVAEPLDKATQAYRLFSVGKKPIEVAVNLGISGEKTIRLYKEFWKLKHLNGLYQIYPEIRQALPSFLKLHKSLKKQGMQPRNVEWFVDILKSAAYDIPALEIQIEYVKSELEAMQYKKNKSIDQVNELNDRVAYLQSVEQSLIESCNGLRQNIEYLENEQERLETFTETYKRTDKKYCKIKKIAQRHIDSFLTDRRVLVSAAVIAVIEAL
jgi:transposase